MNEITDGAENIPLRQFTELSVIEQALVIVHEMPTLTPDTLMTQLNRVRGTFDNPIVYDKLDNDLVNGGLLKLTEEDILKEDKEKLIKQVQYWNDVIANLMETGLYHKRSDASDKTTHEQAAINMAYEYVEKRSTIKKQIQEIDVMLADDTKKDELKKIKVLRLQKDVIARIGVDLHSAKAALLPTFESLFD